uniref:Uncharacterized protein n=1 Tax=Anopheles darlingi TaxID=43151 RepID=A0A2M4D436_ANODA
MIVMDLPFFLLLLLLLLLPLFIFLVILVTTEVETIVTFRFSITRGTTVGGYRSRLVGGSSLQRFMANRIVLLFVVLFISALFGQGYCR